jgi:hypothetical protein
MVYPWFILGRPTNSGAWVRRCAIRFASSRMTSTTFRLLCNQVSLDVFCQHRVPSITDSAFADYLFVFLRRHAGRSRQRGVFIAHERGMRDFLTDGANATFLSTRAVTPHLRGATPVGGPVCGQTGVPRTYYVHALPR